MNSETTALPARSQALLDLALPAWDRAQGLLVFAYGSLIWKPEFELADCWPASTFGFHRALRLRSLVNRGTTAEPGLVLCLLSGGSCRGLVYRVAAPQSEAVLHQLWAREMVVGSYEPRWLSCNTAAGPVRALSFTLSRQSPGYVAAPNDEELLHVFRHARGRYGTTLDYLLRTVNSLREHGICDTELERQWRLAASQDLCEPLPVHKAKR